MSSKTPLSVRLANAERQVSDLQAQLEAKTKAHASAESRADRYNQTLTEANEQLNQISNFLDCVTNPPPRRIKSEDGYGDKILSVQSRLMAYLTQRG